MVRRSAFWLTLLVGALSLFAVVSAPPRPAPVQALALATPAPSHPQPDETCAEGSYENWKDVEEFPLGRASWAVDPLESNHGRPLYFVTITLKPGECIPYESGSNQKDGAVILIVHDGEIEFTAEPFYLDEPEAAVEYGVLDEDDEGVGEPLAFGTPQVVGENEWVSQNTRVWFTFRNTSSTDEAEIWKVVWANYTDPDGCGGNCK